MLSRPEFTSIPVTSTDKYPNLPVRVTVRNADGTTHAQYTSDFNCFTSNKEVRRRNVWALLNGKTVTYERIE